MAKITKGALAMVLAGSVTFSVISALLTDQSSQQLAEENALTLSGDQKQADGINQAEKTVKDQPPTANVEDVQIKPSPNISAFQTDTQQNKEQLTKTTAINSANTDTTTTTTPASTTISDTSIKAPKTTTTTAPATTTETNAASEIPATTAAKTASETTTAVPTTTGTNTTSGTTTTTPATNHGQQVSQAVKEKVASHQDKKETNGKKM